MEYLQDMAFYQNDNGIIINADCLNILPLIPDSSIDLIVTDPPYNISQDHKVISRKGVDYYGYRRMMDIKLDFGEWDKRDEKEYKEWCRKWFMEICRVLKDKGWMYIFFDKQKVGYFDLEFAKENNIKSRTVFVWAKSNPVPSFRKVNWISATEFVWVGSKGDYRLKNFLHQKEMMNYYITPNSASYGETNHPTEKPVELIKKFILTSSNPDDIVLDPFLGSGTTAVACKMLNRRYIGIEISKDYCNIARDRLQKVSRALF